VIVFVNCITVWAGATAARLSTSVAINFYGFTFINGLTHVIPSFMGGLAYNPGLVTTWLMFFPAAYLAFQSLGGARRGIAVGILCHIILMGSMKLAARGLLSEWALCGAQVLNVVPLLTLGV
jgi:hypothetical protein